MFNNIINNCIRATILPNSGKSSGLLLPSNILITEDIGNFSVEEYLVSCRDNAELSTIKIDPKIRDEDLHILHFLGSSQTYEAVLPQLIDISRENHCRVISFNYRGVAKSSGRVGNIHDLFRDGVTQVERLLDAGVKAKDIIISGFSLGGGLATKVVHHYHKMGEKLYLFNDRSFGKLSDVAGAWYGNVFKIFFRKILKNFDWDLDVDKLYLQIPEKYRRHINLVGLDDEVVPFYASLSKSIIDLKQKVSEEYLLFSHNDYKQKGHKAPLNKIFNKYGETGTNILKKFVNDIRQQVNNK